MKLCTYNVNSLKARHEYVGQFLDAVQPDILGIQELKLEESAVPVDLFESRGYHVAIRDFPNAPDGSYSPVKHHNLRAAPPRRVKAGMLLVAVNGHDSAGVPFERVVLTKLCALFGVQNVLQGEQWLGLIDAEAAGYAEEAATVLCEQLRPEAIGLTDAFDFPDRILNSALGKHDGNVYEALYREAKKSSLNVRADGTPILRPKFFDSVEAHLDTDFLALGNATQATPAPAPPAAADSKSRL